MPQNPRKCVSVKQFHSWLGLTAHGGKVHAEDPQPHRSGVLPGGGLNRVFGFSMKNAAPDHSPFRCKRYTSCAVSAFGLRRACWMPCTSRAGFVLACPVCTTQAKHTRNAASARFIPAGLRPSARDDRGISEHRRASPRPGLQAFLVTQVTRRRTP